MKAPRWISSALLIGLALSTRQSFSTPPERPLTITSVSADSVSLTRPLTLTIHVRAGYTLTDVSASVLEGEGYRIESQVTTTLDLLKPGDTTSFTGVIQPLAKGTWKVQVGASGHWSYDAAAIHLLDEFYIHLSDTLNRVFDAGAWIRLSGPVGRLVKKSPRDTMRLQPMPRPRDAKSQFPGMPPRQPKNDDDTVGVNSATGKLKPLSPSKPAADTSRKDTCQQSSAMK